MSALPLASRSSHVSHDLLTLRDAFGMSFHLRYRNRKEKMDRYAKRTREYLMHCHRTLAFSGFEIGQVALGDAGSGSQISLCHLAPFAQDTDRVFASGQSINDDFRQYNFCASRDRGARLAHNLSRTDILIGSQGCESFIFPLRQNSEFFAVRRFNKLHFGHDSLSIVNLTAIPDGGDNDRVIFDVKNDPPVANAQPRSTTAFKPLHIAVPGFGKNCQLGVDSPPHVCGKTEPLPRGRAGERDLHLGYIAKRYILVKYIIAQCNIARLP